ncbi:unnamed protein product [Tilletia laevis]|uniref:Uncharacterized protein n=3 Tax=Tilletia TaxID=13289 RepID=A0A8X7MRY7_9BASI|nr:hypothetical protein CF335_g5262 [Tilletia laevis]KAE8197528.1 hypothetical protein CF328_g3816 [Tilletia controversa]KAE8256472.1 hypothetical protein A4X03_0g5372 [Tilletia caries]KAE8245986.1 hypothetical protein A4X06_0g5275 [Tilletia controversa]CAD6886159.1 unnamed protein product [Tilletia caries]
MEPSPPESPTISRTPINTLDEHDPDYARARRDRAIQLEAFSIASGLQRGSSIEARNQRPARAGIPAGLRSPPPGQVSPHSRLPHSISETPRQDGGEGYISSDGLGAVPLPWLWSDAELMAGFATAMSSRRQSGITPPASVLGGGGHGTSTGVRTGTGSGTGRNSPIAAQGGLSSTATITASGIQSRGGSKRKHGRGGVTSSSLSQSHSRLGSLSRMPNTRGGFVNGVWHPDANVAGAGATHATISDEGGLFRRADDPALSESSHSPMPEAFVHLPSAPIQAASFRGQATADGGSTLRLSRVASGVISASRSLADSNRGEAGAIDDAINGDGDEELPGTYSNYQAGTPAGGSVVHLSFEVVSGPDLRVAVRKVQKWKDQVAEIEAAIPPEELPPPQLFSFSCRARKSDPIAADSDLPNSATRMLLRLYYSTIRPPDSSFVWCLPLFVIVLAWAIVILATAGRALADARRLSPVAAFVPLAVMAGSVCINLGLLYWALRAVSQPLQDNSDDQSVDNHGRQPENTGPRRIRIRARSSKKSDNDPASEADQTSLGEREGRRPAGQRRRVLVGKFRGSGSELPKRPVNGRGRSKIPKLKVASASHHATASTSRISISGRRWSSTALGRGGGSESEHRSRGVSLSATPNVAERKSRVQGTPLPPPTDPQPSPPVISDVTVSGSGAAQTRPPSHDQIRTHSPSKHHSRPRGFSSPTRAPRPSSSSGQHGGLLTVVSPTPPPGLSQSHSRHSMASVPAEGPLAEEDEGTDGQWGQNERGGSGPHPAFTTMLNAHPSTDELTMRERHRAPGRSSEKGSHQRGGQLQPNPLSLHAHSASSSASSLASSASWPPSKREISTHISNMANANGDSPRPGVPDGELWVAQAGAHLSRRSRVLTIQATPTGAGRSAADTSDTVATTYAQDRQGAKETVVALVPFDEATHDLGSVSPGVTPIIGTADSSQTVYQEAWTAGHTSRRPSGQRRAGYGGPLGLHEEAMASLDIDRSQLAATWSHSSALAKVPSRSSLTRPLSGSGSGQSPPQTRSQSRSGSVRSVRPRIADFRAHQAARSQYVLDVLDGRVPAALPSNLEGGFDLDESPAGILRSQSMSALRASWSRASISMLPAVKGSSGSRWVSTRDDDDDDEGRHSDDDDDIPGPSQHRISPDPRLTSPLLILLPRTVEFDGNDSDEVDVQPVPKSDRLNLGIALSDGNRSSGDTPEPHTVRHSRDGRRPSSSLSSVYSASAVRPDYIRKSMSFLSQAAAFAMQSATGASDVLSREGAVDDVKGKGRMTIQPTGQSRDRSMSESVSAPRRRDRTSPIPEDAMHSADVEPLESHVQRQRSASASSEVNSRRASPAGSKMNRRGRGASVSGSAHHSRSTSPAMPDVRGLGITIKDKYMNRMPVELPLWPPVGFSMQQGRGPSLILHSPSGGAAGTGFPLRADTEVTRSVLGTGRLPFDTPGTTETRSSFKFMRLEGPDDDAYVEKLRQRADGGVVGDPAPSRRASPSPGGFAADASPAGSFGRRLGMALRLVSEAEADASPSGGGAEIYRKASSAGGTAAVTETKVNKTQPRLGFMSRTPEQKRWVIIRNSTPVVVRSSAEHGQDRLRAQVSQNGDGDGGPSVDQAQSTGKGGHHKSALGGRIGSMASIAAHPMVLVLTLAVNVLTIGTLAAGMAISALLLQAAPALGGTLAATTSSSSQFVLLKASELSIGRGGAIFGLGLGAVLVLTMLVRLSCLLTQVISWRVRQRKRRRRTRRRVAVAPASVSATGATGAGASVGVGGSTGVFRVASGTGGEGIAEGGSKGTLADRAGESGLEAQQRRRQPGEEETMDDTDSWELV